MSEPSTMTAAILHGQRDVRIERRPIPQPGTGEVVVAVEAALTDGTDLKVYRRGYHARMITPPTVFGHEYAGRISAVGPKAAGWAVGDRIVGANSAPCGECFHCRRDEKSLCEDLLFVNGAYAEFLCLPARIVERNLLRIPDGLTAAEAALTEPLACVVKGIRDLGIRGGETLAVIGSGPIGLMAARLAVLASASVLLVGRRPQQLEIARRWGAGEVLNAGGTEDLPRALEHLNGGRGPDRIFEATGIPAIWEQAIASVRKGGTVNLFGGCPAGSRVSFDTSRLHYGEVRICSSFHHTPADVRRALELIRSRQVDARALFDSSEPLERLPQVLEEMDDRMRTLKTVILPTSRPTAGGH